MRPALVVALAWLTLTLAARPASSTDAAAAAIDLAGVWRFELDPEDQGLVGGWGEGRLLSREITLPGALQSQGFGDEISVDTRWTGQIVDRSFFTSPRYAPYREPG